MNRKDVLEMLGKYFVHTPLTHYLTFAVIMPSFDDVKVIRKEFQDLIDTIPPWLGVHESVTHSNIREFKWNYGKILFINKELFLRGYSLTRIYRSSRVPNKDEQNEYLLPCLSGCKRELLVDFDDEQ
jgi:hypothetical protein